MPTNTESKLKSELQNKDTELSALKAEAKAVSDELKVLREESEQQRAELAKYAEELKSQQEQLSADQEKAQKIILEHESKASKERKLRCKSVSPEKMLARAKSIWAETADENNPVPTEISTNTFRVSAVPLGSATPIPSGLVENCRDPGDALCTYFAAVGVPPGNYQSKANLVSTKTHKVAAGK